MFATSLSEAEGQAREFRRGTAGIEILNFAAYLSEYGTANVQEK